MLFDFPLTGLSDEICHYRLLVFAILKPGNFDPEWATEDFTVPIISFKLFHR
jgi:hypothetical protein